MKSTVDSFTAATRARYDRIARIYDPMEWVLENCVFRKWRRKLWSGVPAGRVLEIGVGTGKNIPFYPEGTEVTAIDLSERMLERARRKAGSMKSKAALRVMDAEHLELEDDTFDAAVATFVFCSVPDPVVGLREMGRVTRPHGDIWLMEHVRVDKPLIGRLMDALNPIAVRLSGANINRRTVENVRRAGLEITGVENLSDGLVKLIHAKPPRS
jgi:phosphatidylethanolamine/phosphatidyl-N-methylethanolamine N-methyltransferase